VRLRPPDHLRQRLLGGRRLTRGLEDRGRDSQILGLSDRIRQLGAQHPHPVQVASRLLHVAATHLDFRAPPERQRHERAIARCLGFRDRPFGLGERAVESALLAVANPQVVMALGHALAQAGSVEGGEGDLPGADRLGVACPKVGDDAQVVGAATGRGEIAVAASGHERLREVVRRLVDAAADQGQGAPCIEGLALDRGLVPLACLVQC
jgi:hypothetical protein